MALVAPSGVTATTLDSSTIELSWVNEDNYQYIEVWEDKAFAGLVLRETIPGRDEYYQAENLDPSVNYCYELVGGTYEPADTSPASAPQACDTTYADLEAPSDIAATPISGTEIEIIFKDNSEVETGFTLQRKTGAGAYGNIAALAPNQDFFRDSGLATGNDYLYQVRAENGVPSAWDTLGAAVQTIAAPAAPTNLALSDVEDKRIRLDWTASTGNVTGYKIERSGTGAWGGEEVEIAVIGTIISYLSVGLVASTQYWYRVRAYGPGGNSAYSNIDDDTTLAVYALTEYEKWIRNPNIEPVYLAEIYTKMTLSGFEVEDDPCYKVIIGSGDRGIDILEVLEDGTAYVEKTSVATVKATVNTFWFDYDNRILYVHATGGVDPDGFLVEGAFWLYFSTHKNIEFTANGRLNFFLPFLAKEDISDITQEIKPYFEGNFSISSGSIAFKNDDITAKAFFDIKYETYTWINSKVIVKAGRDDFTYAQFKEIFTARVNEKSCSDEKITLQLRDIRQDMEKKLVLTKYGTSDYPNIEEEFVGVAIPICFGYKENIIPICIDWNNKKFSFHDGRSKNVAIVKQNGTTLTEDTDYYVDLQRSIITLDRDGVDLEEEDIIEVSFSGIVNSADEVIVNHAEIFKYIMNTYLGLADAELDHDSIYAAKYANENELSVFLYEDTPYDDIIKNIEHSGKSFTFQDTQGRLGLKPPLATAPSSVKYVINEHIFNHSQRKNKDSLFWKVNVYFDEDPKNQNWKMRTATNNDIYWQYGVTKELDIYTYLYAPAYAQSLADDILALLNKQSIVDSLPMLLFDELPGNLIVFSRNRLYDSSGIADEITLRIIRISKSPASGKTIVTMELV